MSPVLTDPPACATGPVASASKSTPVRTLAGGGRREGNFRRSLIFHYVPVDSVEISRFYNPLLRLDGSEVAIAETADGGACGDGWAPTAPH